MHYNGKPVKIAIFYFQDFFKHIPTAPKNRHAAIAQFVIENFLLAQLLHAIHQSGTKLYFIGSQNQQQTENDYIELKKYLTPILGQSTFQTLLPESQFIFEKKSNLQEIVETIADDNLQRLIPEATYQVFDHDHTRRSHYGIKNNNPAIEEQLLCVTSDMQGIQQTYPNINLYTPIPDGKKHWAFAFSNAINCGSTAWHLEKLEVSTRAFVNEQLNVYAKHKGPLRKLFGPTRGIQELTAWMQQRHQIPLMTVLNNRAKRTQKSAWKDCTSTRDYLTHFFRRKNSMTNEIYRKIDAFIQLKPQNL